MRSSKPLTMLTWCTSDAEVAVREGEARPRGRRRPTASSTCSLSARRAASITSCGTSVPLTMSPRQEVRQPLGVVDDDAEVAEVVGVSRQLGEQRAARPGRGASCTRPGRPSRRGRGPRRSGRCRRAVIAERLLAEDVEAGLERREHDLDVRACGRRDQDGVEPAGVDAASASRRGTPGMPKRARDRLAHGPARARRARRARTGLAARSGEGRCSAWATIPPADHADPKSRSFRLLDTSVRIMVRSPVVRADRAARRPRAAAKAGRS